LGAQQRRNQALQAELDEIRVTLEQTIRAKRTAEQQVEEANTRINELQTINVNLAAAKSKLENEYSALQADYDEVHKELRVSY
jgi:paramyosin (fragment)